MGTIAAVTLWASSCGGDSHTLHRDASIDAEPPGCADPDRDADGFSRIGCGGTDCDDDDARINPGANDDPPRNLWSFVRLDATNAVGSVDLAVDAEGIAFVAFATFVPGERQLQVLHLGEIGPGNILWTPFELAHGWTYPFDLAASEADVEMLFAVEQRLFYATRASGFAATIVGEGEPGGTLNATSIVHDSNGGTHAFYQHWARPLPDPVHAVRLPDGSWEVVESVAGTAAAFSANELFVAHPSEGDLFLDRFASGEWSTELVDDIEETGFQPAIVLGGPDEVFISYQQYTRGDLRVARRLAGTWDVQTLDDNGRVGGHSSIALDGSGRAAIVYSEVHEGSVRFAHQEDEGWTHGRLPSPVRASSSPRLAYAPTGAAIVVFGAREEGLWVAFRGRDGIDQDCSGVDAVDVDFDRHASVGTGGDDCFDDDASSWQCRR